MQMVEVQSQQLARLTACRRSRKWPVAGTPVQHCRQARLQHASPGDCPAGPSWYPALTTPSGSSCPLMAEVGSCKGPLVQILGR